MMNNDKATFQPPAPESFDLLGRYARPEMKRLWNLPTQYHLWTLVEISAAEAQGKASARALTLLKESSPPSPRQVAEAEVRTRHDVTAFLQAWRYEIGMTAKLKDGTEVTPELVGDAVSATHWGLTSSDVVDSANAVRWQTAGYLVAKEARALTKLLAQMSLRYWETPRIGRTHGQWAEETKLGHWFAEKALAMDRAAERCSRAAYLVGQVKLSGPVGDYKRTSRVTEEKFAVLLQRATSSVRLEASEASLQIVNRDRLAELCSAVTGAAGVVAGVATEIRLASQSERGEMAEFFHFDQMGSSSMPHKRNPVISENLTGMYTLVSGNSAIVQNVQSGLWGERDLSHSCVERIAVPLVMTLGHYMAFKGQELVGGLVVDQGRTRELMGQAKVATSSGAATSWLVEQGVSPKAAWALIQGAASSVVGADDSLEKALGRVARASLRNGDLSEKDAEAVGEIDWAKMDWKTKPGTNPQLKARVEILAE